MNARSAIIVVLCLTVISLYVLAQEAEVAESAADSTGQPEWAKDPEKWKEQKDWGALTSDDLKDAPDEVIKEASENQASTYFSSSKFKDGVIISKLNPNEYKLFSKAHPEMDFSALESNPKLKEGLTVKEDKFRAKCPDCPVGYTIESKTKDGQSASVRVAGDLYNAKLNDDGTMTISQKGEDIVTITQGVASASGLMRPLFGSGPKDDGIRLTPGEGEKTSFKYHTSDGPLEGSVTKMTDLRTKGGSCGSSISCVSIDEAAHQISVTAMDNNKMLISTNPKVWKTTLENDISDDSKVTVHEYAAKCCFVTATKNGVVGDTSQANVNFETPRLRISPVAPGGSRIDYMPPGGSQSEVGRVQTLSPMSRQETEQLRRDLSDLSRGQLQLNSPIRGGSVTTDGYSLIQQEDGGGFIVPPTAREDGVIYDYADGAWRRVDMRSGHMSPLSPLGVPESVRQLMGRIGSDQGPQRTREPYERIPIGGDYEIEDQSAPNYKPRDQPQQVIPPKIGPGGHMWPEGSTMETTNGRVIIRDKNGRVLANEDQRSYWELESILK